mgnify:CR=1 FL=1
MRRRILLFLLAFISISQYVGASDARNKYNFNSDWLLSVGDTPEAQQVRFQDTDWKKVTLPRAFNEDEAFRLSIDQLTDTVMWYRKHFRLPAGSKDKKVFIEFEGVRQGADQQGLQRRDRLLYQQAHQSHRGPLCLKKCGTPDHERTHAGEHPQDVHE